MNAGTFRALRAIVRLLIRLWGERAANDDVRTLVDLGLWDAEAVDGK